MGSVGMRGGLDGVVAGHDLVGSFGETGDDGFHFWVEVVVGVVFEVPSVEHFAKRGEFVGAERSEESVVREFDAGVGFPAGDEFSSGGIPGVAGELGDEFFEDWFGVALISPENE